MWITPFILIFAFLGAAGAASAQELTLPYTDTSRDIDGRDLSADLADLFFLSIEVPARVEYYPPARIGDAFLRRKASVCSLLTKASMDRLPATPVREVARYRMALAEFARPANPRDRLIGALNGFVYHQIALANGLSLHVAPSLASAAAMIRAGRLTHLITVDGAARTFARANGLTLLGLRELGPVEMWIACSPDTPIPHRIAMSEAWDRLLASGDLGALFARHDAEEGLLKPALNAVPSR